MSGQKKKRLIGPLYVVAACVFVVMAGSLILIEVLNLDPDMIKMSGSKQLRMGVITAISEDGIEILDKDNDSRSIYRPIIPVLENKKPFLDFSFLEKARAAGQPLCFLAATTEKNGDVEVAYNFHQCANTSVGPGKVVSGTHQYVSNLRSYGTVTLIGYKDGTRAGDKGKSQLEKNKFLLLSTGNSIVQLERATTYGFPNGRYSAEDIGKRFCMSQHDIVNVKFSKDMKPVGLWKSSNPGVYLWTCKAADAPGHKSYAEIIE